MDKLNEIKAKLAKAAHKDSVSEEIKLNELGLDSLDVVELLMAIEEEFGVEIPDEKIEGLKTVGDVVDYIQDNMK